MGVGGESVKCGFNFNVCNKIKITSQQSDIGGHGGLRVVDVRGPSLVAGLQVGDIITEVEGTVIAEQDDIRAALRSHNAEDAVYLKLIREDTLYEVDVQPSESNIAVCKF